MHAYHLLAQLEKFSFIAGDDAKGYNYKGKYGKSIKENMANLTRPYVVYPLTQKSYF